MEPQVGGTPVPGSPIPSKENRFTSTLLVLATLLAGILIGTVVSRGVKGKEVSSSDAAQLTMPAAKETPNQFTQVAKIIEPSVVNINTESTIKPPRRGRRGTPNPDDDGMGDFFDRFFGGGGNNPFGGDQQEMRQRSLGSGVIVDPKGYIVTNAHVVEKADRIRVNLMGDGPLQQYDAKVIGSDKETDLAVIKIEPKKGLTAAKIGNSDVANVGDWVLAVGSPFGLGQTVTAGIISYKGRSIDPSRQFQSFIQTDAAINPGNSGGPLVNMNGEIIGINTAIFTQSAGSQGVGFALPVKTVVDVYNQIVGPDHRVARGSIGIQFNATDNPALKRMYGEGVTITFVPDGPAKEAGLKTGDTIVSVDGRHIKSGDELVADIASRRPGSQAKIGYVRDGKEQAVNLTIADRAKLFPTQDEADNESGDSKPVDTKLGISVKSVTPDLAEKLDVPANKGVIVTDVKAASFAEDIGLSRGDVILEVNRKPVNGEEDFRKMQAQLKSGEDVVFLVRQGRGRNAGTIFLAGTLP